MRLAVVCVLAVSLALPVRAQDRDPSARQVLIDLAYTLGEAHALRQACAPNDQRWRVRMLALVDQEHAEHAFAERLRNQFNTGFVAGQSEFSACSSQSRRAAAAAEQKGANLARRLAQARIPIAQPEPQIDGPG